MSIIRSLSRPPQRLGGTIRSSLFPHLHVKRLQVMCFAWVGLTRLWTRAAAAVNSEVRQAR